MGMHFAVGSSSSARHAAAHGSPAAAVQYKDGHFAVLPILQAAWRIRSAAAARQAAEQVR